ncbi:MAG: Stk1 family PASTA domain-containing Ser/Thr kinase [Bacilli bacterium]
MMNGKRIGERYIVERLIGGGGMANVYLAYDPILERNVAIKILRGEYAQQDEFVKRFRREAQSISSLLHPNIVEVYDVGEEDGMYYIVMEYIEGPTLKEYIASQGKLAVNEAVCIMQELTSAIGQAHDMDIIHRDIKPQNILVNRIGHVKVTDFGIAQASTHTTITQTHSFMGSVHYISPEQARGGYASKGSDVYALGIVFYELLSGSVPYAGENVVSIALKHLESDLPSIRESVPDVPQSIANIIAKATAKDASMRYESAITMNEAFHTALDADRVNEPPLLFGEDVEKTIAIPIIKSDRHLTVKNDKTMPIAPVLPKEVVVKKRGERQSKVVSSTKASYKDRFKSLSTQKKWVYGSLSFLALSILIFILVTFVMPTIFRGSEVKVPDVIGKSYEEAVKLLKDEGLEVKETRQIFDDKVEKDGVIRTEPTAGTVVKDGSPVIVFKSKGSKTDFVGSYIGKPWSSVENTLSEMYGEIEVEYIYADAASGVVVDQLPKSGVEVTLKETTLKVWISKGQESFTLSNMVGWTKDSAVQYANEKGLKVNLTEEYSDTVAEGLVISHSPGGNGSVSKGESIKVIVSKGTKEPTYTTKSISVLIPYDNSVDDGLGQLIEVYIEDRNHSFGSIADSFTITADQSITLDLELAKGSNGRYKIVRNGITLFENAVYNN